MGGQPIAKAKDAASGLATEPDDAFQVIQFSQSASQFGWEPVPAIEEHQKALRYGRLKGEAAR
jgi:hypothetical protein